VAPIDRGALRMTDAERDEFLAEHCWGRLSTVNADGEPHVAPIGYVYVDGRFYFHAMTRSRRGRDLAAGSLTCLCVDDGVAAGQTYTDRRGVIAYSRCRIVVDESLLARVRTRFAEVFFGDPATPFERRTHSWYELAPYRYASWDFGRIPSGADRFAR
jgi:nitroimidazol reductase NimA-like FMN-containing flavoprotein (pyridoxamine 5'-phosphate oxidase superfamily)